MSLSRRSAVLGFGAAGLAACTTSPAKRLISSTDFVGPAPAPVVETPSGTASPMRRTGRLVQGGSLIFDTAWPGAEILVDGALVGQASAAGCFVVGLDRDAPERVAIEARARSGQVAALDLAVARGDFDVQRINGLPQDTVTPEAPETLAKIAAEAERKAEGFASNIDADYFRAGFDMPLQATRVSGRFGGQRILNGTPSRPHYGADLAAPVGTPIHAPCDGVVSFAETGLHFEGGLIMIDHGQGLVTAYLHLSRIETAKGDLVRRGQKFAEVGAEGRATGPHLCWRMKWRNRNLDPTLLVGLAAP